MNTGLVYRKSTGSYFLNTEGKTVVCTLSSKLRKVLIWPTADRSSVPHQKVQEVREISAVDPVAVGDLVGYVEGTGNTGMITEVYERRNALTRRAPGRQPLEQVIVANVDQVIAVLAAAQPSPNWHLLDRYLASATACDVPALICLNKVDLVRGRRAEKEITREIEVYRQIGYTVLLTSAASGEGIEDFCNQVTGRVSALVGKSGVGKTSLLNAVEPELGLRVKAVNVNIDKGRHTTTHLEMFPLAAGGAVIDTPGMKQFGLWKIEQDEVALLFVEMAPHVGTCKFGLKCTHIGEPGCAILKAVEAGIISRRRHESYIYLREHLVAEY